MESSPSYFLTPAYTALEINLRRRPLDLATMSLDSDALLFEQEDLNLAEDGRYANYEKIQDYRHQHLSKPLLIPFISVFKVLVAAFLLIIVCVAGSATLLDYHIRVYSRGSQACKHELARDSFFENSE